MHRNSTTNTEMLALSEGDAHWVSPEPGRRQMNQRHASVDWVPLTTSHSRFHDCQSRGNIKHGALRRAKYVFPVGTEINASSGHLAPIIIYRRRGTRASAPISNAKRDKPMRQSFTDTRKSIQRQDRVDTRMSGANNLLILGKGQSGAPPRFYILKKQMHRGRSQLGPLYEVMKKSFQRALPLPKVFLQGTSLRYCHCNFRNLLASCCSVRGQMTP